MTYTREDVLQAILATSLDCRIHGGPHAEEDADRIADLADPDELEALLDDLNGTAEDAEPDEEESEGENAEPSSYARVTRAAFYLRSTGRDDLAAALVRAYARRTRTEDA